MNSLLDTEQMMPFKTTAALGSHVCYTLTSSLYPHLVAGIWPHCIVYKVISPQLYINCVSNKSSYSKT